MVCYSAAAAAPNAPAAATTITDASVDVANAAASPRD